MSTRRQNARNWTIAAGIAILTVGVLVYASPGSDAQIESTAKNSEVFKTFLNGDSIDVKSRDGFVTLTGTVTDLSHKDLAEETVANEAGVVSVNNKLVVTATSTVNSSDAWIGVKVKTTLLSHRSVNGFKTQVDVKDRVVTLRGESNSRAQKELTGDYAQNVDGVDRVINNLAVTPSTGPTLAAQMDDASITAQVKVMLLYHRSTSALKTVVKTKDGVVALSGKAQNAAEKELVTKLVNDVQGVKEVQNQMTIAPGK